MVALISVHMGEFLGCEPKKEGKKYPKVRVIDPRKTITVKRAREELARTRQRARREAIELFVEHKARLDQASVNQLMREGRALYNLARIADNEAREDESEFLARMPRSFYLPPERDRWLGNCGRSPHYLGKRRQGRKQGRRPWRDLQR